MISKCRVLCENLEKVIFEIFLLPEIDLETVGCWKVTYFSHCINTFFSNHNHSQRYSDYCLRKKALYKKTPLLIHTQPEVHKTKTVESFTCACHQTCLYICEKIFDERLWDRCVKKIVI